MSDIAVTVTNPGSAAVTIGAGGSVSATVSSGGSVAVNLPGGEAAWTNITGKPTTFTPATHTHLAADITDRATALVTSVNGQTGAVTVSGGGGGAGLSDAAPQDLGAASAGVSITASRADHVHEMPTAADVGALDNNSIVDGGTYAGYIPENTITITTQPTNQTAVSGAATFSVVAAVAPVGALSYQWQKSENNGFSWAAVSGATSSSLSLTSLTNQDDNDDQYRVIVSSAGATSVTSNAATLTVSPPPSASGWVQLGADIDGAAVEEGFARSLSISNDGTVLAAGAWSADVGGQNAGVVRVYSWNGTAWSQRGADFTGGGANQLAGRSVALNGSGSILAIGLPGAAGGEYPVNVGKVKVYSWTGTAWAQRGADVIPVDISSMGQAGTSVAMDDSGDLLVVGQPSASDTTGDQGGKRYVYQWDGTAYAILAPSMLGFAGDSLGSKVAVSGDGSTVVVSSPGDDFSSNDDRGSIIVQGVSAGQYGTPVSIFGPLGRNYFGIGSLSVNLDGTVIAQAGGLPPQFFSVLAKSGGTWGYRGPPEMTISAGLYYSVAISDSGTALAVGTGHGGTNAGITRVYDWNGSGWVQRGADIAGEAASDVSGDCIAMSADGTIVAIGAYGNDGGGTNSGHVRVYQWQ